MKLQIRKNITKMKFINGRGWCFYECIHGPYVRCSEDIYDLSPLDRSKIYRLTQNRDGSVEFSEQVWIPAERGPVMVLNLDTWIRRISSGRLSEGRLETYIDGCNKWTSRGHTTVWATWRKPTEEELRCE